jgi:hypothetical protein
MFSREIQLDTHDGPVTLTPRWLRVPGAVKYSGLSRSKLYELLSDGRIRSICVSHKRGHSVAFVSLTESRSTRSWKATRPCEMLLVSKLFRAQRTRVEASHIYYRNSKFHSPISDKKRYPEERKFKTPLSGCQLRIITTTREQRRKGRLITITWTSGMTVRESVPTRRRASTGGWSIGRYCQKLCTKSRRIPG